MRCRCGTAAFCPNSHSARTDNQNTLGTRAVEGRVDGFAPAETALLRMADSMADTPSKVSDDLYAELRRYFAEEQLIELAATASLENFRARYNRVFDVGSDGLYRKGSRFKER